MKNITANRKVILLMLLTVFFTFSVQSVSHGFFWEIIGAIGEALGAIGEAIGGTVGAVGTVLGLIVDVVADTVVIAADATHLSIRIIATAVWDTGSVSNTFSFPDGGLLGAVVSNLIYLWDPHTGRLQGELAHDTLIRDVAVNPDGNLLASGSIDGTIQLWNPDIKTLKAILSGDTRGGILSVAFNPDGSLLASGSADGTIQLWNPHTETLRATISGHTNSAILSVVFSPDGSLLASGSVDGTIRLWDPYTRNLQTTTSAHIDSVLSMAFSPDGFLLASASADGTVGLWNPHTGQQQTKLDHQAPVLSIAFNPDGSMFASGSVDGTARLWDPETGKILATLGHESPVRSVTFSPDGSTLITGSENGKARQWQITIDLGSATTSTGTLKPEIPFTGPPASVNASTTKPLTETILHESIVTLTLSERNYERSIFAIRDAVTVSGIDGVTIPWHQPDRKNDTEITIELEFDGDFDTDATLTFTVSAGAIANYNGPAATVQIPVSAITESVVATTVAPLAETTLDESVVTLTLTGRNYVRSSFTIERAVTISGIDGVTVDDVDRISNTKVIVELEFNGDFDADTTLTFNVGAGAIAGYDGSALTAELPVTGEQESIVASTPVPLTEATLDESVITLTLDGAKFASSIFDIRDAVSVSGIDGVTIPWHQPDKKNDTQITIELEFRGNIDTDSTLTFIVDADAIENYKGPALTAEIPVT
ncbi:WD40 repeat domain-containing protein, partial [Candidatus Poribacteria bacterium]|nr:WD40 repeat domain-containing protein [Candidatus Poribacteria bacterium]